MKTIWLIILAAVTAVSCMSPPQRGGSSGIVSGDAFARLRQPDNPRQTSRQTVTIDRAYDLSNAWVVRDVQTNQCPVPSPRIPQLVSERITSDTTLGAAYEDRTKQLAAKFKAAAPFLLGAAVCGLAALALFYFQQWEKGSIASLGAVACTLVYFIAPQIGAVGIACILGIVSILCLLVVAVLFRTRWDANKNWIPDALEKNKTKGQ